MADPSTALPRVTIEFCTQCRWMLRAAYFAQELLSTFNTALGEVALQPSTGGTFTVHLYTAPAPAATSTSTSTAPQKHLIWDRKAEGGFPETKELKRRVRDVIEPTRDLGHVDRHRGKVGEGGGEVGKGQGDVEGGKGEEKKEVEEDSKLVVTEEEDGTEKVIVGTVGGYCKPGDTDCW